MVPGDVQLAFAQAAAADGIILKSRSFDWLCEQGHVGLERVAKARRDPALAVPVTAALETLAAMLGGAFPATESPPTKEPPHKLVAGERRRGSL